MKHAAAMKYGGELVAAEDCNYDSFKELVPLCPNCKEPVFLRTGGDRISPKGTEFKIGPHWCHFKGVSAEQVASCESRVSSYTDKDRQRIAAQARGQRLKLLQRWFWSVVKQDYFTLEVFDQGGGLVNYLDQKPFRSIEEIQLQRSRDLIKSHVKTFTPVGLLELAAKSRVGQQEKRLIDDMFPDEYSFESQFCADNQKIAVEVLGFLASRQSQPILKELLEAIFMCLWLAARTFENDQTEWFLDATQALYLWAFRIPWASEFQRLEAESKKGAA